MAIFVDYLVVSSGRRARGWIIPLLWVSLFGTQVVAQPTSVPELDAAYMATMARPNDIEAALHYAKLADDAGQPMAAIPPMERVLRLNPRRDDIRLGLAALYLKTRSPELAAIYAQQALSAPDIPPDIAGRARQLLATAEQGTSRSLLRLELFAGIRHNSDANQATSLSAVGAFSPIFGPVLVLPPLTARPDWSTVLTGQVAHRYDLGLQTEGTWETNVSLFDQRFFHINHAFNLTTVDATTGPRFGIGRLGNSRLSIRPFASAAWIGYGDSTYATLYGGGLSGAVEAPDWQISLTGTGRAGSYQDTSFRPQTRPYTGPEWSMLLSGAWSLNANTYLNASISWYQASARVQEFGRHGPAAHLSMTRNVLVVDRKLEFVLHGSVQRLRYGGPNPQIDPFTTQVSTQWEAGAAMTVPIAPGLGATVQYAYFRNNSTYDIYRFQDHAFSIGVRYSL